MSSRQFLIWLLSLETLQGSFAVLICFILSLLGARENPSALAVC